jgi:hypothetical protein
MKRFSHLMPRVQRTYVIEDCSMHDNHFSVREEGVVNDAPAAKKRKSSVTLRVSNPYDYVNHMFKIP